MNLFNKYLLLLLLPCSVSIAQTEGTTTNTALKSSLHLSKAQAQNERVKFLLSVAQSYVNENNMKAAVQAYERVLSIDPEYTQARYIVGQLYITTKQYRKAEAMLLKLTTEFPEDFKLWNNLAWLYATADDPAIRSGKKAVKYAHEAMTLAPTDYHVWSTLSEAYYVSGDYEKAHRAILQMASLAVRYGTDVTKESVQEYNQQILKCKRALDTLESMESKDETTNKKVPKKELPKADTPKEKIKKTT